MTAALYDRFLANALGGLTAGESRGIDYLSDDIRATLHTASYVPDKATHDFVDDLTDEVSGAGYTAGGQALTGKTLAVASSVVIADCDDVVWTNATITARRVVISDRTPAAAADQPLILYNSAASDVSSTNGTWTFQVNANGLFRITIAAEA